MDANKLYCTYVFELILATAAKNNLPHVTEGAEQPRPPRENPNTKMSPPKACSVVVEVRDWWREQLAYNSNSSDDE